MLRGAAVGVPAALAPWQALQPPLAAAGIPGAYSMAMHLHSSFSEGWASMDSHLHEATRNAVDVVWWTDHDNNLSARISKHVVHFTSLTGETGDGPEWIWTPERIGPLTTSSGGGIVTSPASPSDPVPGGSMHLLGQSTGSGTASFGYYPFMVPAKSSWKHNLANQTITLDVLPKSVGPDAWLEVYVMTSYHPATAGRSPGQYALAYRVGGPDGPGTRHSTDRAGVVTLACTPGTWNTVKLHPDRDLAALFPGLDGRDNGLYHLRLRAVSRAKARAEGYFDHLRFDRASAGELALTVQRDLMTTYASKYPRVAQRPGVEVSYFVPHINWYGGKPSCPTYDGIDQTNYFDYVHGVVVPQIHASGGLASYNHPYGVSFDPPPAATVQDAIMRQIAVNILPSRAGGVDIMEVGYPSRGGADLAHHVGLWDVMSRNAVFLTGNGVTDDHGGTNWQKVHGGADWLTYVWAPDRLQGSLLHAMLAGRSWCASLTGYRGALDLVVDGAVRMGSVSVSTLKRRSLAVTATKLPTGAKVQVVQGPVDYAGALDPMPGTRVVASLSPADLSSGPMTVGVDTSAGSFVRTQVRNSAGTVVAVSNPVWLLRKAPPGGIPPARAA